MKLERIPHPGEVIIEGKDVKVGMVIGTGYSTDSWRCKLDWEGPYSVYLSAWDDTFDDSRNNHFEHITFSLVINQGNDTWEVPNLRFSSLYQERWLKMYRLKLDLEKWLAGADPAMWGLPEALIAVFLVKATDAGAFPVDGKVKGYIRGKEIAVGKHGKLIEKEKIGRLDLANLHFETEGNSLHGTTIHRVVSA